MQQNYYIKQDSSGHILDISNTYKQGYVPVVVDSKHMDMFKSKDKSVVYNDKEEALNYSSIS